MDLGRAWTGEVFRTIVEGPRLSQRRLSFCSQITSGFARVNSDFNPTTSLPFFRQLLYPRSRVGTGSTRFVGRSFVNVSGSRTNVL